MLTVPRTQPLSPSQGSSAESPLSGCTSTGGVAFVTGVVFHEGGLAGVDVFVRNTGQACKQENHGAILDIATNRLRHQEAHGNGFLDAAL